MNMRYCLRSLLVGFVCLSVLFLNTHIVSAADNREELFTKNDSFKVRTGIVVNSAFRVHSDENFTNNSSSKPIQDFCNSSWYKNWLKWSFIFDFTDNNGGPVAYKDTQIAFDFTNLYSVITDEYGNVFRVDADTFSSVQLHYLDINGRSFSRRLSSDEFYIVDKGNTFDFGVVLENGLGSDAYLIQIWFDYTMGSFYTSSGVNWADSSVESESVDFEWESGWSNSKFSLVSTVIDKSIQIQEQSKGLLQGILDYIKNLPTNIANGIKSFFDNIVNSVTNMSNAIKSKLQDVLQGIQSGLTSLGSTINNKLQDVLQGLKDSLVSLGNFIIDGIKGLFVPDDDSLTSFFDRFKTMMADRFGALYEVCDLVFEYADTFKSAEKGTITFPTVSVPLAGTDFVFGGWEVKVIPDGFGFLIDSLKLVISVSSTVLFVNGLRSRFDKVVS